MGEASPGAADNTAERPVTDSDTGSDSSATIVTGSGPSVRRGPGFDESVAFDERGRLVFTATPLVESHATLVIASSLFAEFQRNYRREALLARAAASAGITSIRFHYRGAGNSIGDTAPTLDTMTEDMLEMAGAVSGPVVMVGTRLGSLVVARARGAMDVPSVLWEPVVDGAKWVQEVVRACMVREVAKGGKVNADTIKQQWVDDGVVSVLGETVPAEIVDQVGATSLVAELVGRAPVQMVQMGRDDRVRPDIERVRAELTGRGLGVEVLPVVGRQTWWVNEGGDLFRPLERDEATGVLIEGILDFARRAGGGAGEGAGGGAGEGAGGGADR